MYCRAKKISYEAQCVLLNEEIFKKNQIVDDDSANNFHRKNKSPVKTEK